jgi:hypothetical protein
VARGPSRGIHVVGHNQSRTCADRSSFCRSHLGCVRKNGSCPSESLKVQYVVGFVVDLGTVSIPGGTRVLLGYLTYHNPVACEWTGEFLRRGHLSNRVCCTYAWDIHGRLVELDMAGHSHGRNPTDTVGWSSSYTSLLALPTWLEEGENVGDAFELTTRRWPVRQANQAIPFKVKRPSSNEQTRGKGSISRSNS